MKSFVVVAIFAVAFLSATARAQSPAANSDAEQLAALNKKIDEQNAKLDALSQQILKIQEQLSKPGVMIGETASAPATSAATPAEAAHPAGNTHTVTRGETLTSIAKMYKVGVEELQKFNHIENDRKLQIGQTIMIPNSNASSTASPAESQPNE